MMPGANLVFGAIAIVAAVGLVRCALRHVAIYRDGGVALVWLAVLITALGEMPW